MTRVAANARLHFGLFRVPPADGTEIARPGDDGPAVPLRSFGGVGLMVDEPATVVSVRPDDSWRVEGALASRAQAFAQRFVAGLPDAERRPFQILVERCPAEHSGLGLGTQLGLSVARGLATELGFPTLTALDLAERVGRGERSAVGVHGFDRGGLIFEAGKRRGEFVSPLLARVELPEAWRVLLAVPAVRGGWHGERERMAFERNRDLERSLRTTERLSRIAFLGLLPAAMDGDLDAFGEAVYEFNRAAGEPFAAEQGGPYCGREVEELIARVRRTGVRGVGQSSWGPAAFAVVADEGEARALALAVRGFRPDVRTTIAKPCATGAEVIRVP